MASVQRYTAADRRKDVGFGALGVVALVGLIWLVSDDQEERDADQFVDLWELGDPDALSYALEHGKVRQADVQHVVSTRALQVQQAVDLLAQAHDILDDDERDVLEACMRPTYPELLLFTSMFSAQEGISPGAFMRTFMDPDDDTSILAEITRHVHRIRATYAQG